MAHRTMFEQTDHASTAAAIEDNTMGPTDTLLVLTADRDEY